ncbi:MFS transporter [Amycolatopsis nivea]
MPRTAAPEETSPFTRRVKIGIAGALSGMALGMLDSYIVATALPSIAADLGGPGSMTWIITAYALAIAASTQVWGKLSDQFDRKAMFLLSVAVFLAGSMLCGLAPTMGALIGFRALQGIGAGGLLVGAMAMVQVLVPPKESTRISSWTGLLLGLSLVGGPLAGGFLTDALSWRWIFYVNVPFGLLCLAGTVVGVRLPAKSGKARIDYGGTILLVAAVVCLTLTTSWIGTRYAWNSPTILGLCAAAIAALTAFVFVERRCPEPLVPFRMFRTRNFALAQVLGFAFNVTMVATVTFLPLYFQNARDVPPSLSGLLLIPMTAGMVAVMNASSRYLRRTGRFRILPVIGSACVAVGMTGICFLGPDTDPLLSSLPGLPLGAGLGCLIQNTILIIRLSVDPRDLGAALGLGSLTRTLGSGIGAALFGSLYVSALTRGTTPAAVADGLHAVAGATLVVALLSLAAACFVREVPLTDRPAPR